MEGVVGGKEMNSSFLDATRLKVLTVLRLQKRSLDYNILDYPEALHLAGMAKGMHQLCT